MDKYLIAAFRPEIATAILNSQQKLNPDGDAYISKDELQGVLDFFGEKDINNLLKETKSDKPNSIFEGQHTPVPATAEEEKDKKDLSEYTEFMKSDNAALRDDGTAAYELQNDVASDLLTSSTGTPYEAQMKSLYEAQKELIKKHGDTSVIEAKIEALNEAVQEYIKLHQQDITNRLAENGVVKQFKYGKNGEKNGYYVQTFQVKANNTINNADDATENVTDGVAENVTDGAAEDVKDSGDNQSTQAVGGITYSIEVVTDKLHAIGHIDADTENSDITAVAVYKEQLQNGAKLNFSGNFRQTIEKNNNRTDIGASVDYSKKKFSAGGYGIYEAEENDGTKRTNTTVEGYARYGKSIRGSVGYISEAEDNFSTVAKYAAAKINGRRNINDNLSLSGSLEAKYGVMDINWDGHKTSATAFQANACGGVSFKSSSSDFSANVLANVNLDKEKSKMFGSATTVTTTILGNVSNDKIDVTTTLSAMNTPDYSSDETASFDYTKERKTSWSSSITIGLKKLLGKNVTPSFTYNLSSDDQVKHNVAVNLGINF